MEGRKDRNQVNILAHTPIELIRMQRYAYDGVQPSDSISGPTCTNRAAAVAELRELRASILVYVQINLAYCAMLLMLYFTVVPRYYRCQNCGSLWGDLASVGKHPRHLCPVC